MFSLAGIFQYRGRAEHRPHEVVAAGRRGAYLGHRGQAWGHLRHLPLGQMRHPLRGYQATLPPALRKLLQHGLHQDPQHQCGQGAGPASGRGGRSYCELFHPKVILDGV